MHTQTDRVPHSKQWPFSRKNRTLNADGKMLQGSVARARTKYLDTYHTPSHVEERVMESRNKRNDDEREHKKMRKMDSIVRKKKNSRKIFSVWLVQRTRVNSRNIFCSQASLSSCPYPRSALSVRPSFMSRTPQGLLWHGDCFPPSIGARGPHTVQYVRSKMHSRARGMREEMPGDERQEVGKAGVYSAHILQSFIKAMFNKSQPFFSFLL